MDWLFAPIDATRGHEVGMAISWHARLMVLGWGVLAPLAVIAARFFKILPGQDWPRERDSQVWWRSHWMGQTLVLGLSVLGLILVLPTNWAVMSWHNRLGYLLLCLMVVQVALGLMRGSKGGPTAPAADGSLRGHHYDMTPRRRAFEALHKSLGYAALVLAVVTIVLGLWKANGPVWMWLALAGWWTALVILFVSLQKRGLAVDTYQAIWGDDPAHPGNQIPAPGWGMHRPSEERHKGASDVRRTRRNRLRGY